MSISQRLLSSIFLLLPIQGLADTSLPAWLIRLPESVPFVFVAEADESTFHRYEQIDGRLVHAGSYYMSVGQNGWGKERNGDLRTPIGTYIVTEQLDTERMHEKYGVTAYVLDYPNAWDHRSAYRSDSQDPRC